MAQRELENTGERSLEDLQDLEQLAFLTVQKVENGLGRDATNVEREALATIPAGVCTRCCRGEEAD